MKKNPAFEHWIADHLMDGMIMMEPYGYREEDPGNFLHIFRISLQFEDEPAPFEGVAFIPIPFKQEDSCEPQQVVDSCSQDPEFDQYQEWLEMQCSGIYTDFDPLKPIW